MTEPAELCLLRFQKIDERHLLRLFRKRLEHLLLDFRHRASDAVTTLQPKLAYIDARRRDLLSHHTLGGLLGRIGCNPERGGAPRQAGCR